MQRPNLTRKKEISTRKFSYTYPKKQILRLKENTSYTFLKKFLHLSKEKKNFQSNIISHNYQKKLLSKLKVSDTYLKN